ncbi:MAG TPA: response regulator [Polyangia bacterium]|jgi:DNA-binding response OmpR family regulator
MEHGTNLALALPRDALVVVADGDPADRRDIARLYQSAGVRLIRAATGPAALGAARLRQPDLMLLDLDLPEADGIAVCRELKSQPATALLPVILVGWAGSRRERLRACRAGADHFFAKPIPRSELLARSRALLDTREATRALEERRQELRIQSEFVRFLVQDLRAPMTTALTRLDSIRRAIATAGMDGEEQATMLNDAITDLRRVAAAVSDLRDIYRLEEACIGGPRARVDAS